MTFSLVPDLHFADIVAIYRPRRKTWGMLPTRLVATTAACSIHAFRYPAEALGRARKRCSTAVPQHPSTSLLEDHAEFLELVGSQGGGGGSVTMTSHSEGKIAEITLRNPATRGSVTGEMMLQLAQIVDQLCPHRHSTSQSDGSGPATTTPRGLILRGTDGYFSAGANFELCTTRLQSTEAGMLMCRFMTDILATIRAAPFISVAVINGPALGGGAELATATDFRVVRATGDPAAYLAFVHAKVLH